MSSKRKHPRIPLEAPLLVRKMGVGLHSDARGQIFNLSEGGAGGRVSGGLLPGQVVLMEVVLPGALGAVRLNARVSYCDGENCGFEFLAPGDQALRSIREICQAA